MIDSTMVLIKKVGDKWYSQGSGLLFNTEIELYNGAILFPRQYDKNDLTYWTFKTSIKKNDISI